MEKLNVNQNKESEPTQSVNTEESKETEKVFFGTTKDGANVYDRPNSHFHGEGGLTPELLAEALKSIDTKNRNFIKEKVDFDHPIGEQTCVGVDSEDDIVMVYRKGRSGQTPMVKNRQTEPCNSLIAIMRRNPKEQNTYELITSYIGEGAPREPWDPGISSEEELKNCEDFWRSHALIYNDDLIDWEKTKAFEFMSESEKQAELMRQKVFYAGLFLNPEDLYQKIQPTLEKTIMFPHVTTNFKPNVSQLYLDQIGENAKIHAIGYGNNGINEGLLVKIETEDPILQKVCDDIEVPHITLSISKNGQAKDTAYLDFKPLEAPIELTGKYGLFSQGKVIAKKPD